MSEHIDSEASRGIDTDCLPVAVNETCYKRCRKLSGELMNLFNTAEERNTDELALICEGKRILRPCAGLVVRTEVLTSSVSGPIFGQRNMAEGELFNLAAEQNEIVCLESAFVRAER